MYRIPLALLALLISVTSGLAAEWRAQVLEMPARVNAIDTVDGKVRAMAGGLWYEIKIVDGQPSVGFVEPAQEAEHPDGALPDGQVVTGSRDIARAWFGEPTDRYDHGALGDKIEASTLEIETRDGKRRSVRLKDDAVFEDLKPRLVDLDGDGFDEIVVVKSYLNRGSVLAVIAERNDRYEIVAETPPLGTPYRWLNPAGIADFTGDGKPDIALVTQPHVGGLLQLWSWTAGALRKVAEVDGGVSNHVAGTRAIGLSAVADFDGDGIADLAVPALDRGALKIVSFAPDVHAIATIDLPAKAITNFSLMPAASGPPAIVVGLEDGTLAIIRRE